MSLWRQAAIIAGAWALVALVWTPPTILVGAGGVPPLWVAAFVALGFVPWAMATPLFLRWSRRFLIAQDGRFVFIHAATGLLAVPVLVFCGVTLSTAMLVWSGVEKPPKLSGLLVSTLISSLYAAPTYIALVAIAQGVAFMAFARERERLLARAQLEALKAQLNPHFLFNTLNAVCELGYRDPALADRALAELSALVRAALAEDREEASLREELGFIGDFVALHGLLRPEGLRLELEVEPEAWLARAPPLILQPLVENAIVHGKAHGTCAIRLSARVADGRLVIEVENDVDDTPGTPGAGTGLANVRQRLRVLHGSAQAVAFERDGGKARVTMSFPYAEAAQA